MVGSEPDQHDVAATPLAREPPDVELAALGHLGRARISDMRVVRPHDNLSASDLAIEMPRHCIKRVSQVATRRFQDDTCPKNIVR